MQTQINMEAIKIINNKHEIINPPQAANLRKICVPFHLRQSAGKTSAEGRLPSLIIRAHSGVKPSRTG